MRVHFFKILAWLFLMGLTIVTVGDAAHSVATSRFIWTSFENFLEQTGLINMTEAKIFLLLNGGQVFFEFVDCLLFQAPLAVIAGIFAILSYLMSYHRIKL